MSNDVDCVYEIKLFDMVYPVLLPTYIDPDVLAAYPIDTDAVAYAFAGIVYAPIEVLYVPVDTKIEFRLSMNL